MNTTGTEHQGQAQDRQGPGLALAALLVVRLASMPLPAPAAHAHGWGAARPGRQDVPQARHRGQSTRDRQGPGLALVASMPPRTKAAHTFPWCVCFCSAEGSHHAAPPHPPAHARCWGRPSWSSSRSTRTARGTGQATAPGLAMLARLVVLAASMPPPSASSSRLPLRRCPGRHPVAPGTGHRTPSTRDRPGKQGQGWRWLSSSSPLWHHVADLTAQPNHRQGCWL